MTIERCTDGQYAVVDHELQETTFVGTYKECCQYLDIPYIVLDT